MTTSSLSWLGSANFVLTAHTIPGYTGPFEAVRDFLLARNVRSLETIEFPLDHRSPNKTVRTIWGHGVSTRRVQRARPNRAPWTYALDFLSKPLTQPDIWIAFDVQCIASAVWFSKSGRSKVVGWHVDFVPERNHGPLGIPYRVLDRFGQTRASLVVELSQAALDARTQALTKPPRRSAIIPMGIDDMHLNPGRNQFLERRVVYIGSLDTRTTGGCLAAIASAIHEADPSVNFDVIGEGDEFRVLCELEQKIPNLKVHGFLDDHRAQEVLMSSTVGVAPYTVSEHSFSNFGDPGKIKKYLAAGLPIVMTPVPPNARQLESLNIALLVDTPVDTPSWVTHIQALLNDPERWRHMSHASRSAAEEFSWDTLLVPFFTNLPSMLSLG